MRVPIIIRDRGNGRIVRIVDDVSLDELEVESVLARLACEMSAEEVADISQVLAARAALCQSEEARAA